MKSNIPKVAMILIKNGQMKYIYPSLRKTKFFLRNKANTYLKNGYLITFRTTYFDGSTNSGTYTNLNDLNWAYQAFVKEYLK